MMDCVELKGIRLQATHGMLPHEKEQPQWFRLDARLFGDFEAAVAGDDLNQALNYAHLHDVVLAGCRERSFELIEALAGHLCRRILQELPAAEVELTVVKENPPIPGFAGEAAVTLRRGRAWLER